MAARALLTLAAVAAVVAGPVDVPAGSAPLATCQQAIEQGRCDALVPRFAFHAESGQCQSFMYGGCGGNSNNFRSLADCQAACPSSSPATAPQAQAKRDTEAAEGSSTPQPQALPVPALLKCDRVACPSAAYIAAYYIELGCTPVHDPAKPCCVASYDCSARSRLSKEKCHFGGLEFALDEEIPEDKTPQCLVRCKCERGLPEGEPQVKCISIECPELFQAPPEEGCVRQFSPDMCCSTNTYCAPADAEAPRVATCELEGQTYLEGQKFFSDKHPCMTCICQPGFNGTLAAPFCKKAACNLELHYSHYLGRGCVPVFYHERCCPIDWRCPGDFSSLAVTLPAQVAPPASPVDVNPVGVLPGAVVNPVAILPEETKCEFGSRKLSVGELLPAEIAGKCVKCECSVPPMPTCVKNVEGCVDNQGRR